LEQLARKRAFSKSQICNRKSQIGNKIVRLRQRGGATAPKALGAGGKGIRTPDFQLAKLALYQLSYAPGQNFRMSMADFRLQGNKAKCRTPLK
jgi:hypothetical protein